jgi:hypothetical protein
MHGQVTMRQFIDTTLADDCNQKFFIQFLYNTAAVSGSYWENDDVKNTRQNVLIGCYFN